MTHDELANDLANHLRNPSRMLWTDMQLGPAGSPRPDVYSIEKSFAHPRITVYECKVSVSDFRADITAGKYLCYLKYSNSVIFACPHGLLKESDFPSGCGLMVRSNRGWSTRRRAMVSKLDHLPMEASLKLLIDGVSRERQTERVKQLDVYQCQKRIREKLGKDVFRILNRHDNVLAEEVASKARAAATIEQARSSAEQLRQDILRQCPQLWAGLLVALNLPESSPIWKVSAAVQDVRREAASARESVSGCTTAMRELKEVLEKHQHVFR